MSFLEFRHFKIDEVIVIDDVIESKMAELKELDSCSERTNPLNPKNQNLRKGPNFILLNIEKQIVPCESTGRGFIWSHHGISSILTG